MTKNLIVVAFVAILNAGCYPPRPLAKPGQPGRCPDPYQDLLEYAQRELGCPRADIDITCHLKPLNEHGLQGKGWRLLGPKYQIAILQKDDPHKSALVHEVAHMCLWDQEGNPDRDHARKDIWGSDGSNAGGKVGEIMNRDG